MAHRILGLDIGRTAVRLAIVDKSLRQAALAGFDQQAVVEAAAPAEGEGIKHDRHAAFSPGQQEAVRLLLARNLRPDDVLSVALPSLQCMHRTLSFPFKDDKAIADAVGFELENHIPTPLADVVVDFVRIGEKDGQTEVLALAAPRTEVIRYLDGYKAMGIEARRLGLQSLAYSALIRHLPEEKTGVTLLVDIGSRATEVLAALDGKPQMLRSFAFGAETAAELFASQVNSDLPAAQLLQQHALLLPDDVLENTQEKAIAEATRLALQPLLRELRLTLSGWLRRAHRRPDRVLITGGLAQLNGLAEYLERCLDLPVRHVRLGDMPDVRVAEASQLGDSAALAVALALGAGEAIPEGDVDFRQGDLAYEGDFKILRQRLPQLAAFVIIALCLIGIRASLNYRALVTEQEQQRGTLQVLAKQLTGKASTDFDAVKTELERPIALDIASFYPELSAFRALEEVSNIIDKVTEPPDFKTPGGPEEAEVPQPSSDPANLPPPQFRGVPDLGGRPLEGMRAVRARRAAARSDSEEDTPPATVPPMAPGAPGGDSPADPSAAPRAAAGPRAGASGAPAAEDGAAAGGEAPKGEFSGHQIELSSVQIDRGHATLRGDADSQDALLALQQAVDAHRCFGKVKSSSDRITFERHNDWFKFTLEFEIACPSAAAKAAEQGKDGKGAAKGSKAESEEE
jgi:type IV pilus assembly protein PilM